MAALLFFFLVACLCQLHVLAALGQQRSLWSSKAWKQGIKAHDKLKVKVVIALTLRNRDLVTERLTRSSDPKSAAFGQHLSAMELVEMTAPEQEKADNVVEWLRHHDIDEKRLTQSHNRGYLHMNLAVHEARRLLQTDFYHFSSPKSREIVTCNTYHVPESLAASIDYISAAASLRSIAVAKKARQVSQVPILAHEADDAASFRNCSRFTTPQCLRERYYLGHAYHSHAENSLAIYQPASPSWSPKNLDGFFDLFAPHLKGERPLIKRVYTTHASDQSDMHRINEEPDLAFEYSMALTAPQQVIDIKVDDDDWPGNLDLLLAAIDASYCASLSGSTSSVDCGTLSPPRVLLLSFAWPEVEFSNDLLLRQCNDFLDLTSLDVTVVANTPDLGPAGGLDPGYCIDPATGDYDTAAGKFNPSFPASCTWVTAVGGTQLVTQPHRHCSDGGALNASEPAPESESGHGTAETAFNIAQDHRVLSSGGGFSNFFLPWSLQITASAVYRVAEAEHLATLLGRFNPAGRGYPDVSAQAYGYLTVIGGHVRMVSSTSASAVVFASIIALIKSERKAANKIPLGCINDLLYANPTMFNDVTIGANQGCGVDPAFRAIKGWDPVTGLGTPDYSRMRDFFMSLP